MVDEIKLDIKITVPLSVEVAGDMPDKWADGLTNNAERINNRRIEKIPDSGTFQAKVAVPSTNKFSPMIAPAFRSTAGRSQANIIRSQYKNLANSFDDWDSKLALSFATVDGVVAKRFKDQVNNSKDRWATAVANKTLRATGDKIRGTILGQVCYWMVGDYRANQMTNLMEIVAGAPYNFPVVGLEPMWKAAIMGKMVQALTMIIDSDFNATEITTQNSQITQICEVMKAVVVKPFIVAGGALDSLFGFEYADPELILHARVVLI